jgi:hypothetical protein
MKAEDKKRARQSYLNQFQTATWTKRKNKAGTDVSGVPVSDKETSSPTRR